MNDQTLYATIRKYGETISYFFDNGVQHDRVGGFASRRDARDSLLERFPQAVILTINDYEAKIKAYQFARIRAAYNAKKTAPVFAPTPAQETELLALCDDLEQTAPTPASAPAEITPGMLIEEITEKYGYHLGIARNIVATYTQEVIISAINGNWTPEGFMESLAGAGLITDEEIEAEIDNLAQQLSVQPADLPVPVETAEKSIGCDGHFNPVYAGSKVRLIGGTYLGELGVIEGLNDSDYAPDIFDITLENGLKVAAYSRNFLVIVTPPQADIDRLTARITSLETTLKNIAAYAESSARLTPSEFYKGFLGNIQSTAEKALRISAESA